MKLKEFFILLKAFLPAIISVLLIITTAIYFQHQTNVERQECVDNGGVIITGYQDTCIPKKILWINFKSSGSPEKPGFMLFMSGII